MFFLSFHLISSHFISFHLISIIDMPMSAMSLNLCQKQTKLGKSITLTSQIFAGDSEAVACTASADASIGAYTESRNAGIRVRVQTIPRIH